MNAVPPGDRAPNSERPLTQESLLAFLSAIDKRLHIYNFSTYVIETTLDRLISATLPYLLPHSVEPPHDWQSWLLGCAHVVAKQLASREPKCKFIDPLILDARTSDTEELQDFDLLYAALAELTLLQRRAVELCDMLEKTISEAAREMGLSRTTVMHHRARGRAKLKQILPAPTFVHSAFCDS